VLPASLRHKLGISAGDPLDISVEKNRIVLTAPRKKKYEARIVDDPITGFPVIDVGPDAPVLASGVVRELLSTSHEIPARRQRFDCVRVSPHELHDRIGAWIRSGKGNRFLTCSITELGLIRVMGNVRTYGMDVAQAKELLLDLKTRRALPLEFTSDANGLASLPKWVKNPLQATNGHLFQLAINNGAVLAAFDKGIPGAQQIL
jgi:predicted nucleic acid-binding protein